MFGKRGDEPRTAASGSAEGAAAAAATTPPRASSSYSPAQGYPAQSGEVNTLLGKGSSFEGKLTFEGTVRIDGRFKGQIVANDTLIIGDEGVVEGEITVGEIVSSGTVKGTLRVTRSAEFLSPGRVEAELFTASLRIDRGVSFDGQIHMKTQSDKTS
jgi:cytoskeletal protein CcmA (bactofilin family)